MDDKGAFAYFVLRISYCVFRIAYFVRIEERRGEGGKDKNQGLRIEGGRRCLVDGAANITHSYLLWESLSLRQSHLLADTEA
jgi:hypothetical protein